MDYNYYKIECNCGAEVQIPAGEKCSAECPKCGLTIVCDETGDILRFVEHVRDNTHGTPPARGLDWRGEP